MVQQTSDREFFEAERQAYIETLDEFRNVIVPQLQAKLSEAEKLLTQKGAEKDSRLVSMQRDLDHSRQLCAKAQAERDEALSQVESTKLDHLDLRVNLQTYKDLNADLKSEMEHVKSSSSVLHAALKARETKDDILQGSVQDAKDEIAQLREQLKQARERETTLEAASDAALQQTRLSLRKSQEDLHTLSIQTQALVESKRLVDQRLEQAEATVLHLKSVTDREKEKVALQRDFMMKRMGANSSSAQGEPNIA